MKPIILTNLELKLESLKGDTADTFVVSNKKNHDICEAVLINHFVKFTRWERFRLWLRSPLHIPPKGQTIIPDHEKIYNHLRAKWGI